MWLLQVEEASAKRASGGAEAQANAARVAAAVGLEAKREVRFGLLSHLLDVTMCILCGSCLGRMAVVTG